MFMKNILNIADVKKRFTQDSFGLLKEIIRKHLIRVPFQSVTSFGAVKFQNGRPAINLRNVLHDSLRGVGGLCHHNNYSLKLQLESIGFNATTISGCFRRTGFPASHNLTLVKIAPNRKSAEKRYLVDVGCGIPLKEPVPIDDLPYCSRAGGLNFRYEKIDENNIQRIHENGDAIMGPKAGSLSPQDYTIELTTKSFPDFTPAIYDTYCNPNGVHAHHGIYCFRYLDITDNDFDIVCIRGLELIRITKETRTSQLFQNYNDLRPKIDEFFPMLDSTEVNKFLENHAV